MTIDDPSHGPASVDGRGLYCERVGAGPALVLIHSAFLDSRMWDPQVEVFGRGRTIVRYDVRGRGRSTGERQGGSDAEDLEQLLDGLGITRAVILGNSDGARIACEFAARALPRVVGLVLVAGNPPDLDPTPEEENRFMDGFAATEGALLDLARSDRREEAIEKILDIWAPQV
ncbi:MAG: alpha/beta fold hydrolase, partial [Thermoplasmata archaeon]